MFCFMKTQLNYAILVGQFMLPCSETLNVELHFIQPLK